MPSGYVRVWCPGHPMANSDGYALEHRKVLHDAGVAIPDGFHVHHLNEDRADNRPENLGVKSPRDHVRDHIAERGGMVTNQYGSFPMRA